MSQNKSEITQLLKDWSDGEDQALDKLMPLVFDDLHRMASRYLNKESPGHILQSTALVNEVLIKLLKRDSLAWKSRRQFYGFVARQMRNTLVDYARERLRAKRGGGIRHSTLDEAILVVESRRLDLVALDDALTDLGAVDPEAKLVVELKFIVGLTLKEIADILDVSLTTVRRRWKTSQVWLLRELSVADGTTLSQLESEAAAGGGLRSSSGRAGTKLTSGLPSDGEPPGGGGDPPFPLGGANGSSHFLVARFPDTVPLGFPVALQARIALRDRDGSSVPISLGPKALEVMLVLHSPSFGQQSGNMRRLFVPGDKGSEWAGFTLKALRLGVHRLHLAAYCGGTLLGTLDLETRVVHGASEVAEEEEYLQQIGFRQGVKGDFVLEISYDESSRVFGFRLFDNSNTFPALVRSDPFMKSPRETIESLLQQISYMVEAGHFNSAEHMRFWMQVHGMTLWDEIIPRDLGDAFFGRLPEMRRLMIISTENLVPWEMLYPYRKDTVSDFGFLGEKVSLGHWRYGSGPNQLVRPERAVFVLPPGSPPEAEREVAGLRQLLLALGVDVKEPVSDLGSLLQILDEGDFQVLHFACHNSFNREFPIGSAIDLDGGPLQPAHLKRFRQGAGAIPRKAPLVFINACRSDGKAPLYTKIGGWAHAFLEFGASAFVGTLWEVRDHTASAFAREFYSRTYNEQLSPGIGDAMCQARLAVGVRPCDPTWLAYTLYGDPAATPFRDSEG